jgi:hypothetical protein
LLPNPQEVKGHVVFFIDIKIDANYKFNNIAERIYLELQDYLILSRIFNSKGTIGLILACEAISDVKNIRSLIESNGGVIQSRVLLPTSIEYNQYLVVTAIDLIILNLSNLPN